METGSNASSRSSTPYDCSHAQIEPGREGRKDISDYFCHAARMKMAEKRTLPVKETKPIAAAFDVDLRKNECRDEVAL